MSLQLHPGHKVNFGSDNHGPWHVELVSDDQDPFCSDLILDQVICQSKVGHCVPCLEIEDIAVARHPICFQPADYLCDRAFTGDNNESIWVGRSQLKGLLYATHTTAQVEDDCVTFGEGLLACVLFLMPIDTYRFRKCQGR